MEILNRIIYNMIEVHPFHALVVHFPIALTGAALFFILLALWRRSDALEQIAVANIALASVSTLAAGATGWIDNKNIYDGAAPNINIKILLAFLLFGSTCLISISRWRNPKIFHSGARFIYIGGYFVSFALVTILGFLGGIILYGFHEIPVTGVEISSDTSDSSVQHLSTASPTALPSQEVESVTSYSKDVFPIIKSRCINCHGGQKTEEALDLTSYIGLMAGSENGPVVIPGDATNSLLIQSLIENEMPKRGPKLKPDQVKLLTDWINAGAPDN